MAVAFSEDVALREALAALRAGNSRAAEDTLNAVLRREPRHVGALNLLGAALMQRGAFAEAEPYLRQAVAVGPPSDATLYNYGIVLKALRRPAEALLRFTEALAINPAVAETWNNRGTVFNDLRRPAEAIGDFDKAIGLNPRYAEAFCNRGKSLIALKRLPDALAAFATALALKPDLPEAWLGRGNVYYDQARYDEAAAAYDEALALRPDSAEAWVGRGNVRCAQKRHDEAFAAYDKALALMPELAIAWLGRGNALFSLNRDAEARDCYDKAIAIEPDLARAQFGKALLQLSLGELAAGWTLYEWRAKARPYESLRDFTQSLWRDEVVADKTILIHCEQGFGDAIQFFRYVPLVQARAGHVVLEAPSSLIPLLREGHARIEMVAKGEALPHFDLHCPIASLPLAFGTTLDTIPRAAPYLAAPADKVAAWQQMLGARTRPRIGVAWSGNLLPDPQRSIPLALLAPLLAAPADWHSLQKDVRDGDRDYLGAAGALRDHSGELHDFADAAALASLMDLVISIDTAAAHLSGALGRELWILLPFHPDFRWLRDRSDSPWYPTATLFRQTEDGDWNGVLQRVTTALRARLAQTAM